MSDLFDEIMQKKEEKESSQQKEIKIDPNNPSTWDNEMIADYFLWMMNKKGKNNVEDIMNIVMDKLQNIG